MRIMILAAVAALAFASTASAKSCKDGKGHFIKCPAAATQTVAKAAKPDKKAMKVATVANKPAAAARCKDAKGHFVKCGAAAAPMAAMRPAPAMPARAARASTKGMTRAGPAHCKVGVPCGNACIPRGKVCHKG